MNTNENVINWSVIERKYLAEQKIKAGLRAEELREKLDPEALVIQLMNLVKEADDTKVEDIPKLKFKADVLTTVLKKCMPDLRSLEVKETDNKHNTLIIEMKRDE